MPITFICNGVFIILLIFNVLNLKKYKAYFLTMSVIYFLSFFISYINVFDVFINFLQVIALSLLLVFVSSKSRFKLFGFLYSFFFMIIILSLSNIYPNFIIINLYPIMLLLTFIPNVIFSNIYDKLYLIVSTGILLSFVLVSIELSLYTFSTLNLNIVFEMLLVSLIFSAIKFSFKAVCNEKNMFSNFVGIYNCASIYCR